MMKQISFCILFIIGLLTSCSNETDYLQGSDLKSKTQNHFYGIKRSENTTTRAVGQKDNLWYNGTEITVKFLNDPYGASDKIKEYAKEWEQYANITFKYVDKNEDAHVRIGFDWNDERYITWSYIGTDCKMVTDQNDATMSFAYWDWNSDEERKGDVLRAFGHALGLEFEHRHLEFDNDWTTRVQSYWEGEIEDIPWVELKKYVFDPLESANTLQTENYDEQSIMIWPFPRNMGSNTAKSANYELSDLDKEFIAKIYPKEDDLSNATILRIKYSEDAKGNVYDIDFGKILYNSYEYVEIDFGDGTPSYKGKGHEAPLKTYTDGEFEIKIIADKLAIGAYSLQNIGSYYSFPVTEVVLNGVTEYEYISFSKCQNLQNIRTNAKFAPKLKQIEFNETFADCSSLTSIPENLFANGEYATTFYNTFNTCTSLTSIPENLFANNKNTIAFFNTFGACSSLTSIPENIFANNKNVTDFSYSFNGCSSLTSIPENLFANNNNVTDFMAAFFGCSSLTSVPDLWNTHPNADAGFCFSEATQIVNYNDIPSNWK